MKVNKKLKAFDKNKNKTSDKSKIISNIIANQVCLEIMT